MVCSFLFLKGIKYISIVNHTKRILPVIIISQFFCTSLWFAGNAVVKELVIQFHLSGSAVGHITAAVQLGFITGTLCYALLLIADRFSPSFVFLMSAVAGAIFNLGIIIEGQSLFTILGLRFITGFFLAGIYPVGMKIASDHYEKGLGKALGFLVGALVIGTALPHLLRSFTMAMPWKAVLMLTSGMCIIGGALMWLLVPDGPFKKINARPEMKMAFKVFADADFRSASFGYFGHMWELYTFWAFVPVMLSLWQDIYPAHYINIPALSFLIIGCGGPACVISGYISQKYGAKKVAAAALLCSGICCILSPLLFFTSSAFLLITFLILWGMAVIADSPLFSTLVAQNAPAQLRGTALTIVTCAGFTITIVSIQLLNYLSHTLDARFIYMLLAIGPLLGLLALKNRRRNL
jgi:MFS family permease